jgi:hypothetical protein
MRQGALRQRPAKLHGDKAYDLLRVRCAAKEW